MPKIDFKYKKVPADEKKYGEGYAFRTLSEKEFNSFNSSCLGIGDISHEGKYSQTLAVFYDLEGFTAFCNQIDSHLVIPEFLDQFINWLFRCLADRLKEGQADGRVTLWAPLPFFSKFLGDGVLLLWDTDELSFDKGALFNILSKLHITAKKYESEFLPKIQKHVANPPEALRCGVARGQTISVGEGQDYVGSCINVASRLQKLSGLRFAVSRRGLDLSSSTISVIKSLAIKQVELRGIGKKELVYVFPEELAMLPAKDKRFFKDP